MTSPSPTGRRRGQSAKNPYLDLSRASRAEVGATSHREQSAHPDRSATDQSAAPRPNPLAEQAATAARRARDLLLRQQSAEGWWKGEFETNVTADAQYLLTREFLGVATAEQNEQSARWIRAQQRPGGWWGNFHDGPPDLSTTVEAYLALRVAGDSAESENMRAAAAWIREQGGLARAGVITRIWLALFGQWSWDELPVVAPELLLLPKNSPFNLYDFAHPARLTIVPGTLLFALRPVRRLPFTLDDLRLAPSTSAQPGSGTQGASASSALWGAVAEPALRGYERALGRLPPLRVLRRLAIRMAVEWIVSRQEVDGSLGGFQLPTLFALIALHEYGYPLEHPALATALRGIERYSVVEQGPQGTLRRIEAAQSFVWDTALAVTALLDAGLPARHPALLRAARFLVDQEIRTTGDWTVPRPGLTGGCWGFGLHNDRSPDVDDTAEVLLAMQGLLAGAAAVGQPAEAPAPGGGPGEGQAGEGQEEQEGQPADTEHRLWSEITASIERGIRWTFGMQCRDGGWGAFDADNTHPLPPKLPFCDFGEVIDPPTADVTAHAVEMLAAVGRGDDHAVHRAIDWLLADQRADGSWPGRWGVNHIYGTGAVVPALIAAGMAPDHPAICRAVSWLIRHQTPEGGWGEDARSYRDPELVGRGAPTASQTAWALLALLAAEPTSAAVDRGIGWLVRTQRSDGTWDEPRPTGAGFPSGLVMIRYHLYRQVFPLMALGRFLTSRAPEQVRASGSGRNGARRNTAGRNTAGRDAVFAAPLSSMAAPRSGNG